MSEAKPAIGSDAEALAILRWYAEIGVDIALEETPVDRFAQPKAVAPAARRPEPQPAAPITREAPRRDAPAVARPAAAQAPVLPDPAAAATARELAASANSLEELRSAMAEFEGCNLRLTARNLVFADGNPQAGIMLVGEAPGRDEDEQGLPFVGRSGQLLDRMLAAIGLDRTRVYIANTIPWRPPGNRTPTPLEVEICRPFIERQISLVAPKVLVTLGGPATAMITGSSDGITRIRGRWMKCAIGGREYETLPMLHPAYLLRSPGQKGLAWQDLLKLKRRIDA